MKDKSILHCDADGAITYPAGGTDIFEALDRFNRHRNNNPRNEVKEFEPYVEPEPKPVKKGRKPFGYNR